MLRFIVQQLRVRFKEMRTNLTFFVVGFRSFAKVTLAEF